MDSSPQFVAFACAKGVLKFGSFRTKAGRMSPYFFNAGLFNDGESLGTLADFYARAIIDSGIAFDMLFGPAYKGIPLAAAVAVALAKAGRNVPFCFNRKEAKDHGEGGSVIGAMPRGRVLLIDDVISAGTSIRESVDLLSRFEARACGVVIALDRMERGQGNMSAVQEVRDELRIPVIAIATLDDLLTYLGTRPELAADLATVRRYRETYGITA